jgi:signal transduction histidine kinase
MTERREAQQALQEREREIQLLIDAREALAQDLHDEVIQRLYAIGLKLSVWRRRSGDAGSPVGFRYGELIFDIDQVIQQVRGYIDGSPRAGVEGKNFPEHVQRLIGAMVKDTSVVADVELESATAAQLSVTQIPHLLAMIREAASNALQHARAGRLCISLRQEAERAVLTVEDNGVGFDPREISERDGRGLRNLRARAERLGGQAFVLSVQGQGTSVRIEFPLEVSCDVR